MSWLWYWYGLCFLMGIVLTYSIPRLYDAYRERKDREQFIEAEMRAWIGWYEAQPGRTELPPWVWPKGEDDDT